MSSANDWTADAEHPMIKPGRRLVAVHPAVDAFTALTVMRRHEVRHLPVVADDRCVGLLTETDLLRGLASSSSADELTVAALCHRPAPAVPAGSSLQIMATTMVASAADAVLVVNRGVMVGMVTASDVLGAVTSRWRTQPAASFAGSREPRKPCNL